RLTFHDDSRLSYDRLLLAMGGVPRELDLPGSALENVFTLRSFADSDAIIDAAKKGRKAVVIGGGFIGMETAFSLRERDMDVTLVAEEQVPLESIFGQEIGRMFQRRHENHGIEMELGRTVREFAGDGSVQKVVLDNGEVVDADLVIVGVGVEPASDRIQGISFGSDGSVVVDNRLRSEDNIFAAGDVACFPDWRTGERTRIEHWRTAEQQGRVAAQNMLGKDIEYRSIPFFWTTQVGLHFRYVGHAPEWDEIITMGDVSAADFISFYVKDGRVIAAAGNGRDKQMIAIEELMRIDRMPSSDEIRHDKPDLVAILHEMEAVATKD
ncbi:NAD(FAD)-dependent dehydrogenase, partial [candidate division GN15 bacterium]|nr:NAD(FAD)-dependent dehydrogenase [candidate division GN15 bacterium]